MTHIQAYVVELLCPIDQPVAETSNRTHHIHMKQPCPRRGSNPLFQQASARRPMS